MNGWVDKKDLTYGKVARGLMGCTECHAIINPKELHRPWCSLKRDK